jgi:membrane-bound lytic murein transglycosylase B
VPQAIILGILGVETGYGSNKGSLSPVMLATLGFGYPRRAQYFQDELGALLHGHIKMAFQPIRLLALMQVQ